MLERILTSQHSITSIHRLCRRLENTNNIYQLYHCWLDSCPDFHCTTSYDETLYQIYITLIIR